MTWVGDVMLGLVLLAFIEGNLSPIAGIIEALRSKERKEDSDDSVHLPMVQ